VGALSDETVGKFIGENFEATHQKVGTFQIVSGAKQGGNVASYFCLEDGTVVHAVAGPLDAKAFLKEAKWAMDVQRLALNDVSKDMARYRAVIRKAHLERLAADHGFKPQPNTLPRIFVGPPILTNNPLRKAAGGLNRQGQVHLLLAHSPLPKLSELYPIVFEDILQEKTSTLPVRVR